MTRRVSMDGKRSCENDKKEDGRVEVVAAVGEMRKANTFRTPKVSDKETTTPRDNETAML